MKNLTFSKSKDKDVNIIIKNNYYKKHFNNYNNIYNTLLISDTNMRKLNPQFDNIKYFKGGLSAKYLDKYLDLIKTIKEKNLQTLIASGGSSILNLVGYSYFTLNFHKKRLIFIPTSLTSMIYLPITGIYSIDMNYESSYLKINDSYPDEIFIDPETTKHMEPSVFSKSFFLGYLLGLFFDNNFSQLSLKYMKKNNNLDIEEYIYNSILYCIELNKKNMSYPGNTLIEYIIDYSDLNKYKYIELIGNISLFLAYLSYNRGYIYKDFIIQLREILKEFNLYKESLLLRFSSKKVTNAVFLSTFKNKGYEFSLFGKKELIKSIDSFKLFIRGEYLE